MYTENNKVPNLIHFIWAGGDHALPKNDDDKEKSNHHCILKWRDHNPDFQCILWINKLTLPKNLQEEYIKREYLLIDDIDEYLVKNKNPGKKPIILANIHPMLKQAEKYFSLNEINSLKDLLFYEMEGKFHPNYGASSDILRYLILLVYGGAYFDSDIFPGDLNLNDHPAFDGHSFFSGFNFEGKSNDAFICAPKHPFWLSILKKCIEKYKSQQPEMMETFDYQWHTLYRTGPALIAEIVPNALRYQLHAHFIYQKNRKGQTNWTNRLTIAHATLKDAIDLAVQSMLVEMKHMQVCRFADHVRDVSLSIRENILKHLRPMIADYSESPWHKFIQKQHIAYEKEITSHAPVYPSSCQNNETTFFDALQKQMWQHVSRGKNANNFEKICNAIQRFLEKNNIPSIKVQCVIKKIKQRYPLQNYYRRKSKTEIFYLMGAYHTGGLKFIRIFDIFLEEGIYELLAMEKLTKAINQSMPEKYQALIDSCHHILEDLRSLPKTSIANHFLSDLTSLNSEITYQNLIQLLETINTDTNKNFSQLISEMLIQKLEKLPHIDQYLSLCRHHAEDATIAAWTTFKNTHGILTSDSKTVSNKNQIEKQVLSLKTSLNLSIDSMKKIIQFFEERAEEILVINDPAARRATLYNDIHRDLPQIVQSLEDDIGYTHFPFHPETKEIISLFMIILSITGETLLEQIL